MYPCLNQDEWVSSGKFPMEVGLCGAQDQQQKKKQNSKQNMANVTKKPQQNVYESSSKTEMTEFPTALLVMAVE